MVVGAVVDGVLVVEDVVVVEVLGWQRQTELNLDGLYPQAAAALVGKPVVAVFTLFV